MSDRITQPIRKRVIDTPISVNTGSGLAFAVEIPYGKKYTEYPSVQVFCNSATSGVDVKIIFQTMSNVTLFIQSNEYRDCSIRMIVVG